MLIAGNAAADVINDLFQGNAHGHLDQPGAVYLAGQGEGLGALAFFGAIAGVPVSALLHNRRDIGPGLNVIDVGRFAPQAGLGGEGGAGTGHTSLALN